MKKEYIKIVFLVFSILLSDNIVFGQLMLTEHNKDMTISGEVKVCPSIGVTYHLSNPLPAGMEAVWEVTDGYFPGLSIGQSTTGTSVDVIFNQIHSTHTLTCRFRSTEYPYCFGDDIITKTVAEIDNAGIQIIGSSGNAITANSIYEICPSTVETLTAIIPDEYESISWALFDNNFQTLPVNVGSIAGSQGTTPVFSWNNAPAGSTFKLVVTVRSCGEQIILIRNIKFKDQPISFNWNTATNPVAICSGSNINLTLNSSAALGGASIQWEVLVAGGNNIVQNYPAVTNTFTSPALLISNYSGAPIQYSIKATVSYPNLCTPLEFTWNITVNPQLYVSVPRTSHSICATSNPNWTVDLYCSYQINGGTATSIQWYKENSNGTDILLLSGTTNPYTIDASHGTGNYYAVVTNPANGCNTVSKLIRVSAFCYTGGGGTGGEESSCSQISSETFTVTRLDCNRIQLSIPTAHVNPNWIYDTEYVTLESSTSSSAIFYTETPGIYKFRYTYSENGCSYWIQSDEIIVPARADFAYSVECVNGQYNVTVVNNSEYLPTIANVNIVADVLTNTGTAVSTTSSNPLFNYTTAVSPGANTITWTVQSTDATTGASFPDCSKTQVITLPPYPTAVFTVNATTKCPEDFFHLQPATYNPNGVNNKYEWSFLQDGMVPITNYLPVIDFMPPNDGDYDIILTEWNDYGCAIVSAPVHVQVLNSAMQVTVVGIPNTAVCQGDYVDLRLVDARGNAYPPQPHYQWLNGHTVLAGETNATLRVRQSGAYWAQLTTMLGCEAVFPGNSMQPLNVTFRYAPDVKINIPSGICKTDGGFWFEAIVSNPQTNMQYRWSSTNNTLPTTTWQTVTDNTGIIQTYVHLPSTTPLTSDTYTVEVRYGATGCAKAATATVQFLPAPSASALSYVLDYTLYQRTGLYQAIITAANSQTGQHIWSNGMMGNTITVSHGGVYKVTFVNEYGCTATEEISLPRDPKEYMWIVPEDGCYTICDYETLRVIGPIPYARFTHWSWLLGHSALLQGTGLVQDNNIIMGYSGTHRLELSVADNAGNTLTAYSKPFDVNTIKCGNCEFQIKMKVLDKQQDDYCTYTVAITITNPTATNFTLTFSANPVTDGFFVPGTVLLPANSTQTYYLTYVVALYSSRRNIDFDIIAEDLSHFGNGCKQSASVPTGSFHAPLRPDADADDFDADANAATFSLNPNPATDNITVDYKVLSEGSNMVSIYDISGKLMWRSSTAVDTENSFTLNTSSWTAGYYIAVLKHNGNILKQQVIVKQ